MSQGPLAGRIAIVTGASAGIGESTARHLAQAGARVVLNARRAERLEALAESINAAAGAEAAATCPGNCAQPQVIDAMFETARTSFGGSADLVVVNAGRGLEGSVLTSDPAQWEEMIETNLVGAARLMRAASNEMTANAEPLDRPRDIVVLGSVVGRNVSPFSSMYGSTKFAVAGLTEGLRREVASRGVRVTHIMPGFVVSEFQGVAGYDPKWVESVFDKIGPVLEPDDVARAIVFVAQQPAHVHLSEVMIRPTRQEYP
ncbi:MAG: SDR family oxidoreductase [Planctomycetota bacterium]|nr:MAG: SDR family oxidoreductase [Planctomycetota bacterium]